MKISLANYSRLRESVSEIALQRTTLGVAAAGALCATMIGMPALAQVAPATASTGPQLQEIIVTGSLIKRTDIETPSPVQLISNTEMLQMGYTNVSDVLRNLSAAGQGSLSQSFGEAFAAGAQGVALRGLTVGDTLVLIDGKRMVSYPISDDNQRQFTDVSAIPINAVERVEVLKDGASALYGADAIAGVVNVILKKSFSGLEVTAEGGTSQKHDGTTEHLAALGGIGDLDSDGYNAYIAIDFHHQDQILALDRAGTGFSTLDWRAAGGQNTIPGNNGPGSNSGGYPTYGYPASITGYLLNPGTTGPAEAFLPGCSATAQSLNQCEFQYRGGQIQPSTEQINVLAKFTKALGGDWKFNATASVFNSQAEQVCCTYQSTDYAFGGITITGFGPHYPPTNVSYPIFTVPASYPGNPYGAAAPLIYNFWEVGMPQTTTDTNTYRLFTELTGTVAGWDIDADIGAMYARMNESFYNDIEPAAVQTALNNGYVIGTGASNAAAVAAGLAPPAYAYPTSSLDVVDLHASRTLFDLPGGPLALALGGQFFHKTENLTAPESMLTGVQEGDPYFAMGSQNDAAVFTEIDAQVFKSLELDGAVRYDNYNNGVGGATTPQFKVKWKPVDMLALRGTWGRGFRAPSPAEGGSSGELFGQSGYIVDPVLCPNPSNANARGNFPGLCTWPLTGYQVAGSNLKPVKSTNETFGFIFEPLKQFSVSVDYYKIKLTDDIISQSTFGEPDYVPGSLVRGPAAQQSYCPPSNPTPICTPAQLVTITTPVGLPSFASYPYINAGAVQTEGLDVDLQTHFDLGVAGKLSAELNYTHIFEYNITSNGVTYDLAGTHGPSEVSGDTGNPKERAVATLTWDYQSLSVSGTVNYTSSFTITDPSEGINTCADALQSEASGAYGFRFTATSGTPAYLCSVHHFTESNIYVRYAANDHLAVHGSITNLFNAQAPIDAQTYGGGGLLAYDGAFHQDGAIGRFFMVGATYKF
jgi:iron complex outermembrane recepter protein